MSHLIADARFTPDGSTIVCDCGERFVYATPERASSAFREHRLANGLTSAASLVRRQGDPYDFRISRWDA